MRCLPVLSALALSALVAASQLAMGASLPPDPVHPRLEIKLQASDGFSASLENDGNRVTLTVHRHRQYAQYTARGKVSENEVEARFGKLGEVSVAFQPTRTVESTGPYPGCKGDPWETRAGVFAGTIHFRGERGYVEIDVRQAKGKVEVTPNWKCTYRRAFEEGEEEGVVATLIARQPNLQRYFATYAARDPGEGNFTYFAGGAIERREGVRIARTTVTTARASTFTFSHERGRAAVSPPWPFRGSATFRRPENGPAIWRGSLRVPLLGADVVALTGKGFLTTLRRDFPSD
jgi:hypothetical protein